MYAAWLRTELNRIGRRRLHVSGWWAKQLGSVDLEQTMDLSLKKKALHKSHGLKWYGRSLPRKGLHGDDLACRCNGQATGWRALSERLLKHMWMR